MSRGIAQHELGTLLHAFKVASQVAQPVLSNMHMFGPDREVRSTAKAGLGHITAGLEIAEAVGNGRAGVVSPTPESQKPGAATINVPVSYREADLLMEAVNARLQMNPPFDKVEALTALRRVLEEAWNALSGQSTQPKDHPPEYRPAPEPRS